MQSPIASRSLGILKAPCQNDWTSTRRPGAREFNEDAPSSSEKWQKHAVLVLSARRHVATEGVQEHLNFPEDSRSTRRPVASGNSDTKGKDKIWPHHLHASTDCVQHMEKVFSIMRQRYGLSPRGRMENLDVKAAVCGILKPPLFKLQFILGQTTRRICVLPQELIETVVPSDSEADHRPN